MGARESVKNEPSLHSSTKLWLECRLCGDPLESFISLGSIVPSCFVPDPHTKLDKVPLDLKSCPKCGLIQLGHSINKIDLYSQYWYKSSLNSSMALALDDVVRGVSEHVDFHEGDIVLDIGCNDGALFRGYPSNVTTVGIDPCQNILPMCDIFYNGFFPDDMPDINAKAITAIAMFYDTDDPGKFLDRAKSGLAYDGIFVIQMTDLMSMIESNAFDNICHEHMAYYTLSILQGLCHAHGLDIFHIETNMVNGGSLRAYICHRGAREILATVAARILEEEVATSPVRLSEFKRAIEFISRQTRELLFDAKHRGKIVDVLGASTKGNTLLQVSGIDSYLVRQAAEVNKEKFGLYTGGSNIPIVSQQSSLSNPPDYYLILPWHFIDTFVERLSPYLKAGGRFIVPMPEPRVIHLNREGEPEWL